jgi:hypothetical protein
MAWKLINDTTGEPHDIGDTVVCFRGETYTLVGWHPPHKPSSSGSVNVCRPGQGASDYATYYPSVIGATFKQEA